MDVLFDLNGTLLDPGAMTAEWEGAPRGLALRVLDDAVAQAMVDTMTGEFRPFAGYIRAALEHRVGVLGLDPQLAERGAEAAAVLPPYPDAADAIGRVVLAGHRPSVLTNTVADAARGALAAAGLRDPLHAVVGADAVGAYKPDPRIYRHAVDVLAADASQTWLVAGHWWDVAGAKRAGLRTAWVGRDEVELLSTTPEPDVRAAGLVAAVDAIVRG